MSQSPSRYAGIAAVAVLGVGLLMAGKTLAGAAVLGFIAFVVALALSPDSSARFLIGTIGAIICGSFFAYQAGANEITGRAVYHHGYGRSSWPEPVTREESPAKFREATNLKWTLSIFCLGIGTVTFLFHRRLEDSDSF
jgi:hypothetical protein